MCSRPAFLGAMLAGALLLGACAGRGAPPPTPPGQPGAPSPAGPAAGPAGAGRAPAPGSAAPGPGAPAPAGAVLGNSPTPAPAGATADRREAAGPGAAAQPLPPGCGGDGGPAAPPYAVVAPGWGRAGNMPFPVRTARRSGCRYAVGGSGLAVDLRLPAGARAESSRAALQVAGAEPLYVNFFPDGPRLSIGFPAGPNGQEIRIRLQGPLAAGASPVDFQLDLVRDFPELAVAVRQPSGDWRPHRDLDTLPPGPVEVRFRWDRPVDAVEAEARVRRARGNVPINPPPALAWADAQTLIATLTNPPAVAVIDMGGVPGPGEVATYASPTVLRTGQPPFLEAVDPFSGAGTALGPAPPEVQQVLVAPAGTHVAYSAYAPQPDGTWWIRTGWVLDRQAGQLRPAPFGSFLGWTATGALAGGPEEGGLQLWHPATGAIRRFNITPGAQYSSLSPDGRRVAGVRIQWEQEDRTTFLAPADLLVLDLETGQERTYPGWSHYYVTHSEFGVPYPLVWVEGGRLLAGRDYRGRTSYQWVAVDLETGARRAFTPEEASRLPSAGALAGPPGWRLEQDRPWQTVYLAGPDGTRRDLGTGLPAGWLPDGRALVVRWAQSHLRYEPSRP